MTGVLIPVIFLGVCALALQRKMDVYGELTLGAGAGLRMLLVLAPPLVLILSAVKMLRVSGFFALMTPVLAPLFSFFGLPQELAPLMLIRPFSGSAALAVGAELMAQYGVDSRIGRTAAVMLGSSETTFYAIGVYFGAAGIRRTRYVIPAALIADLAGFLMAGAAVRWFF